MVLPVPAALFSPLSLGAWRLAHRVVMPALTRRRAQPPEGVPTALMAEHYAQRSTPGGLLICEAAAVSRGVAALDAPGMHSAAQVNHWRMVVDAVHARGGIVLAQLGHGCDATRSGAAHTPGLDEIEAVLLDYRNAAENAGDAGFDGVELQAAWGALPERFFHPRTGCAEGYGGGIEGRTRFLREALQSLVGVWGGSRVGVCLSPSAADGPLLHAPLLAELQRQGIAYLQLAERAFDPGAPRVSRSLRPHFAGPLIVAGGLDAVSAVAELDAGFGDAVAFGRAFIANPDLVQRLRRGAPLAQAEPAWFYAGAERGYTDYPFLSP